MCIISLGSGLGLTTYIRTRNTQNCYDAYGLQNFVYLLSRLVGLWRTLLDVVLESRYRPSASLILCVSTIGVSDGDNMLRGPRLCDANGRCMRSCCPTTSVVYRMHDRNRDRTSIADVNERIGRFAARRSRLRPAQAKNKRRGSSRPRVVIVVHLTVLSSPNDHSSKRPLRRTSLGPGSGAE